MKVLKILLPALIILINYSLLKSQGNQTDYNLLWKIEGNGLTETSYLYGTMHVKSNLAFNFSDSVIHSILKTDVFALEVDPDSLLEYLFQSMFSNDSINVLKDELNDEEYEELETKFEAKNGYPLNRLKSKNPLLLRSLLEPNYDKEDDRQTFIDGYLYGIARTYNKQIVGLENTKTQTDLFMGSSKISRRRMVTELIEQDTSTSFFRDLMIQAYRKGNLEGINQLIPQMGIDSVMIARNRVMLNSMLKVMRDQSKSLFTAVGVGHLIGNDGLIELLRNEGYTLTPENATFTGIADQYEVDISKMDWYNYQDEALGSSFEIPGKPFEVSLFDEFDMHIYPDLSTGSYYMFYSFDFRGTKANIHEDQMIKLITNGYKKSKASKIIRKKRINKDGYAAVEIIMRNTPSNYIKMQVIMKNNILYGLAAGGTMNQLKQPIINRYFNSFKINSPAPRTSKEWITYTDKEGAFSILMPSKPNTRINDVPHPTDEGSDPFKIKIILHTETSSLINYLVTYNDMPLGYYMENPSSSFNALIEDLRSRAKVVSPIDTIWLDGVEGRQLTVVFDDKYYSKCQIYIRGNRIYKIFKQNLYEGANSLPEDDFFSSFSFSPFQKANFETYTSPSGEFQLDQFSNAKVLTDSTTDYDSYYTYYTSYLTTNPSSGGVYILQEAKINEYFRILNVDTFYNNYLDNVVGWSDTIISNDSILIGSNYGREVLLQNRYNNSMNRARFWLDHDKIFYQSAYLSKDELFNDAANRYFNSFKRLKVDEDFDYYQSKVNNIYADLLSDDTLRYNIAKGALDYHYFDKKDLSVLYKLLDQTFDDDSSYYGIKCNLIDQITYVDSANAFPQLEKLYQLDSISDGIKCKLLSCFHSINEDKGYALYLNYLLNDPPIEITSSWNVLRPFNDSLKLLVDYFDSLILLTKYDDYRKEMLSFASRIYNSDSTHYRAIVDNQLETLYANGIKDLDEYLQKSRKEEYYYDPKIYYYLNLMYNHRNGSEFVDQFTSKLIENSDNDYRSKRAVAVRIVSGLEVNKSIQKKMLSSLSDRGQILEAYEKIGKLEEIPKKFTSDDAIAEMKIYNYAAEDYDYPTAIEKMGEITQGDSTYQVYRFTYNTKKSDNIYYYLSIAGPYPPSSKSYQLDDIYPHCDWDYFEGNWKEGALKLIEDIKKIEEIDPLDIDL